MGFSEEFYIRAHGEQKGPYTFPQLKRLYEKNLLAAETLYWQDGMEQWQPIAQLCESPKKERGRNILRINRKLVLTLAVLAIALGAYFAPAFREAWKETTARGFTRQAAYWKARGFVRDELRKENATVVFDRFDPTAVELLNETGAMVSLVGTVYRADGGQTRSGWRAGLQINPKSKKWRLSAAPSRVQ